MSHKMPHVLVAVVVAAIHFLACQAQNSGQTIVTQGYGINVKLFNATSGNGYIFGGLELSRNNIDWGYVSDSHLKFNIAQVLCRMFHYTYGEGIAKSRFGKSSELMFPTIFTCSGQEANLSLCIAETAYRNLTERSGLFCFNNTEDVFKMRLVDGNKTPVQEIGRLEVSLQPLNDWGSVCDDGFSGRTATIACRYMGYKYGEAIFHRGWAWMYETSGVYGSSNETHLDEVSCKEGQVFPSCSHSIWGYHDCSHSEDVALACTNYSVRLVSAVKKDYHVGTVELFLEKENKWFEVCGKGWNDRAAKVVCKEYNFTDGRALYKNALGAASHGSLTILNSVEDVSCNGSEFSLASCNMTQTSVSCEFESSITNLAAVICYDSLVSDADLADTARIVSDSGSNPKIGFLEIRHMGVWGRVCEDTSVFNAQPVSDKEAAVACRMAGYYGGGKRVGSVYSDNKEYHVWLRGFTCNGTENSIAKCNVPAWGSPGLSECNTPVRIACASTEIKLGLQGGSINYGFLRVIIDGVEEEVCADNWKNTEALAACKTLGFNGGRTWTNEESVTSISTSTVVSGIACNYTTNSFFLCIGNKWGIPKSQCSSGPAGVSCFRNVKIDPGNGGAGMLQLYNKLSRLWSPVCRSGFDDIDASVACRELGYLHGVHLPNEVFGSSIYILRRSNISCNGSESSILDCPFTTSTVGCDINNYTSISCFNRTINGTFKLDNGYSDSSQASGVLRIYQNNTWGYVCDDFFTEQDVIPFCSKIGHVLGFNFSSGVKSAAVKNMIGPYFSIYPYCSNLTNGGYHCMSSGNLCYGKRAVSLICAQSLGPHVETDNEGTEIHGGRLKITINGQTGAICADSWTDVEAQVVCRQLSQDYVTGVAELYDHMSGRPMYLSGIKCTGAESSIFHCSNDGWRKVNSSGCGSDSKEAGVVCFKRVSLTNLTITSSSISGILNIVKSGLIKSVCFDSYFTFKEAYTACKELDYSNAALLKPAESDPSNSFSMIKRLTCKNDESSIAECSHNIGSCYDGQVRILCYNAGENDPANARFWTLKSDSDSSNNGQLTFNLFDKYTGLICPIDFTNEQASSFCTSKGYQKGLPLGSPQFSNDLKEVVWFGNVSCSPSTFGLGSSCIVEKNVSRECFTKSYSAGVICQNRGDNFGVRLMDNEREAIFSGRVEVMLNGEWGTVCSQNGDNLQGHTLCKQLGHADGTAVSNRTGNYGNGTGPIFLKDVMCNNDDTNLLSCSNAGWKQVSGCTHDDDLEVMCYSKERFYPDPEVHFGAVSVMVNDQYKLLCSDNFTDVEATVFCQTLKYQHGKSICCSALSTPYLEIGISRVKCQGNENSLLECSYTRSGSSYFCPSQQYASAACTNAYNDYMFSIEDGSSGLIVVTYYDIRGTVCAEGFDQRDAQVTCLNAGFSHGLAFSSPAAYNRYSLSWVTNLQCQGTENSLDQCPGFSPGQAKRCSSIATVMCLRANDDSEIRVRLQNATSRNMGRMEVQINGTWGSVCHQPILDQDSVWADVVCKELGFRGGQLLPSGVFGWSQGPIWLSNIICNGSEERIKDCQLEMAGRSDYMDCTSHMYDAAVECFSRGRLFNGPPGDNARGYLQMYDNETNSWNYVCDSGITEVEATIVCNSLGYQFGMKQCCSPGGRVWSHRILANVTCSRDIASCTFVKDGTCSSDHYAYVHCSHTLFSHENLTTVATTAMHSFAGKITVSRFGINGHVCAEGINDTEANVMCREIGFSYGQLLRPEHPNFGDLIMLNQLKCSGSETRINDCNYTAFSEAGSCDNMLIAKVLCFQGSRRITYSINTDNTNLHSGRAEIEYNGRMFVVDSTGMTRKEASIFCRSVTDKKYAYGNVYYHAATSEDQNAEVLMSNVQCTGNEETFLECAANFFPQYTDVSTKMLAYIDCHTGANLDQSPKGINSSGILTLYSKTTQQFGTVCNIKFRQKESDVACKMLGYEHGISHCCMPFGYSYSNILYKNFKCNGSEASLFDCSYEAMTRYDMNACTSKQDYVGLTCYNGAKTSDLSISLLSPNEDSNTGPVQLTYLNTPGTICSAGWSDEDAKVACRELNYANGISYFHYKSTFSTPENAGPFWTSNVTCNGSEVRIADCAHSELGSVTSCEQGHYAGVLCMQGSEIEFRLVDSSKPHYGRLQVRVNDEWGSVCDKYWDTRDSAVVCRQMGYATGDTLNVADLTQGQGPVWEIGPRCTGTENNLNKCPLEGWVISTTQSCKNHARDAGVFCYTSVRLGTGTGKTYSHGAVNIYQNGDWFKVCSKGFSDTAARKVCQEMGFYDGLFICCSAYLGEMIMQRTLHPNITIQCTGDEVSLQQCIKTEQCDNTDYASVVCFEAEDAINETEYVFKMKKDFEGAGRISVTHFGIEGRICGTGWDDIDARVFCRGMNYRDGFAYFHSYDGLYMSAATIGPYWMSNISCTGNETDLSQCTFNDRFTLGNCSMAHTAAAVCFNDSGVAYQLNGRGSLSSNAGRIEMRIGNTWGTFCGTTWDNKDARVACRNLGYTDGEIEANGKYGEGSGPIWLRDVQCIGNEAALHRCPHTGFRNVIPVVNNIFLDRYIDPCSRHANDATVFCYKEAKLNQKIGVNSGALLVNHNDTWTHVCDSNTFTRKEARVACRSLLQNFVDGIPIRGGDFGKTNFSISINSIKCTGDESALSACTFSTSDQCASNTYVSVACFDYPLTVNDFKFQIRLSNDSIRTDDNHGIVEIRHNGVWGRICWNNFNDTEATVACKELKPGVFKGGAAYLHLFRNRLPIMWSNVTCSGSETSLQNCTYNTTADTQLCPYDANDAGVVCYRNEGVKYRLTGGSDNSSGRVEIGIDGKYGSVCKLRWNTANSRVLCKSMGFVDGIPLYNTNRSQEITTVVMSFFICEGSERNLLSCMNSGFDNGRRISSCGGDAYTQCFNEEVKIIKTRIGDGGVSEGRAEVYITGLNAWGTICDDEWDDFDATTFCRSLGYASGVATFSSFKAGEGQILLDNVKCNGTEKSISECEHMGISYHNCDHSEDAGVKCSDEIITPESTATITQTASSTMRTGETWTTAKTVTSSSRRTDTSTMTSTATTQDRRETSTATTKSTTESNNTHIISAHSQDDSRRTNAIVAASITIPLAVILIAVVVFLVFKYRIGHNSSVRHKRFHDDVTVNGHDGSVAVSNRMFDMSNPEEEPADGSEVHLDRNGYVAFSKGPQPNPELQPNTEEGFDNPLYAFMRDPSDVGTESTT